MAASAESNQPTELQDLGNDASAGANNQPTTELLERPQLWISFGPVHGDDDRDRDRDVNQNAKQSAWEHMEKSDDGVEYLRSIAKVKDDVKRCYDEKVVDWVDRDPETFMEMMAKDGCLFLQLALHILGAGDLLGYPQQHPFLGEVSNPSSYIPAMYYVGNQIPYVAINALMKQAFFKNIIAQKQTWKRLRKKAGEDPVKLALYQVVVEPQLVVDPRPPPSDILRALRNLFLGSGHQDPNNGKIREFNRETGTEGTSHRDKFPCADSLRGPGIKLKKGEPGITNIKFNNNFGWPSYLYLPPFTVDSHTETLLTNLVRYEEMLPENEREVTAYLCLMNDLITTEKDFKILESSGIIRLKDRDWNTFDTSLKQIVSLSEPKLTPYFSHIRHRIQEHINKPYSSSWLALKIACGAVTLFVAAVTVVQTIYTVLTFYHNPPRS